MNINEEGKYYVSMCVPQDQENGKGQIGGLTRSKMAAVSSYFLDINSNDFFLIDNKKAFTLWLNVPKVTAYLHCGTLTEYSHEQADF